MCIKIGNSELGMAKALMTMSLNAMFAEVFDMEPEDIAPELRLYDDLHMTEDQAAELAELVAEYFDGTQVRITPATTLGEIFDHVVGQEFVGLPEEAF